jgi:hypothetical protein
MVDPSEGLFERQVRRGLPDGPLRGRRLVFEPQSHALVLGCCPSGIEPKLTQVFVQFAGADEYVSVAPMLATTPESPGTLSFVKAWTTGPSVLYCAIGEVGEVATDATTKVRPVVDRGLALVNLNTRLCSVWDTVHIGAEECVVVDLLGVDATGNAVFAVVGFPNAHFGRVDYWLSRLHWASRTVERMHEMVDIFF